METYWRGCRAGEGAEAKARYDRARTDARRLCFAYLTVAEVAQLSIAEILARCKALAAGKPDDRPAEAAVLGAVEPPALDLAGLFPEFEALMKATNKGMSADQVRK